MVKVTPKVDSDLWQAMNEKAANESAQQGVKISLGTLITTAVYRQFPDIKLRVSQLKKEKS